MPQRQALAESIEALAPSEGEGRTSGGIRAARAGISMAPRILEFARARNEALLEIGMGQGEYAWIYWLSYHAWLGHPAGESLLDDIMEMRSESDGAVQMHIDGFGTEEAMWQLRRDIRAMITRDLHNALATFEVRYRKNYWDEDDEEWNFQVGLDFKLPGPMENILAPQSRTLIEQQRTVAMEEGLGI